MMPSVQGRETILPSLVAAGLAESDVKFWLDTQPGNTTDYTRDCQTFSEYWRTTTRLLGQLPAADRRTDLERTVARTILETARGSRVRFLRAHVDAVYDALTGGRSRFVRIEELVTRVGEVVAALVPTGQQIAAEDGCRQSQKSALEIDQGIFLAAVLGSERSGRHLCHAMLLPRPEAQELLPKFEKDGVVTLSGASVRRDGKAAVVTQDNPRFLNAEDQTTLDAAEICVDLALLDRSTE